MPSDEEELRLRLRDEIVQAGTPAFNHFMESWPYMAPEVQAQRLVDTFNVIADAVSTEIVLKYRIKAR